jgi:CubicO group peptidase (beta-lactamase class C family)
MNTLITIEDLLTHRSGIGNADGSYILFPAQNRLELMKRFAYLQPGGEPRNSDQHESRHLWSSA